MFSHYIKQQKENRCFKQRPFVGSLNNINCHIDIVPKEEPPLKTLIFFFIVSNGERTCTIHLTFNSLPTLAVLV